MNRLLHILIITQLLFMGNSKQCLGQPNTKTFKKIFETKEQDLNLYDNVRQRKIPVALYFPTTQKPLRQQQLIIISHGYNMNQGTPYKGYSFLAKNLAAHGYLVASIQHELPTDELTPSTGNPQVVRRPNWERGVQNILYVLNALKHTYKNIDTTHITLLGHSNGGDMSVLFATEYPHLVDKIISFDNRRMPFPRVKHPKIYSLRSSDQPADEGVLPTAEEQKDLGITIIKLNNTIHNDMDDNATGPQRKEMNDYVLSFLEDK